MKRILFAIGLTALALTSCKSSSIAYKSYGPVSVDTTQALTLDEMLTRFKANPTDQAYTFKAPLVAVCQSAGCWVNVKPSNGDLIRIRFKDHFLIPPATEAGSIAYFHGTPYLDTISVAMQKHFLEDAKASQAEIDQITTPKIELNIEADGVIVKKSSSAKPKK
ncbi:MAG: DUF4920 domain-containing protein [Flavobacteriales bacterium]